jgi:hypothetical protein
VIGLVLAAAVAGQAAPAARMPNLYSQPANCPAVVEREVRRQQVALRGRALTGLQYAVWRRLEGCSVPTPVGYHPASSAPRREDAPGDRR